MKSPKSSSGLSKLEIGNYRGYLQILNEKAWKGLTILDLFSLRWIDRDKLRSVVFKELHITEKSEKKEKTAVLKRIQNVYEKSISELSDTFLLKIPEDKRNVKWKSIDDFVDVMYNLVNENIEGYNSIIQCAIFKTMYAVQDILDNRDIDILEEEMKLILKKIKNMPGFRVIKENKEEQDIYFDNSLPKKDPNYIKWRINFRVKQFKSILMKLIYNRGYTTVNLLKDIHGIEIEIDDSEDVKMWDKVLNYFVKNLFNSKCILEQKGEFLSEEFIKKPIIPVHQKDGKTKGSELRDEAKLIWNINYTGSVKGYNVEIQFVHTENKNEDWFNKHEVYDMKKVLSAVCRLLGTLSIGNIKITIKEMGKKSGIDESVLIHHLLFPKRCDGNESHGFLVPMRLNGELRFITQDIYRESLHELYRNYPGFEYINYSEFIEKYKSISVK